MTFTWIAPAAALATAGLIAAKLPRVRGTTLTAPLMWAVAALLAIAGVEWRLSLAAAPPGSMFASVARYIAAAGTFCPLMAILGAKRPQDRGWQWIVASLWIVLALPAITALAFPAGGSFELTGLWRYFVLLLLAVSWLNYAPTRYWHVAAIAVLGQAALFRPALFGATDADTPAACAMLLLAAIAASLVAHRPRRLRQDAAAAGLLAEPLARWLQFRDAWGALWSLRAMGRVNQTAELQDWPVRLRLSGFDAIVENPTIDARQVDQINAALSAILRRFERRDAG